MRSRGQNVRRLLVALRQLARGATSRQLQYSLGMKEQAVARVVLQLEAAGLKVERHSIARQHQRGAGASALRYTVAQAEVDDWLWNRPDENYASRRSQHPPFGTLNDRERETLARMHKLQAKGFGATKIARRLNAEARPTRYGGPWLPGVVTIILKRQPLDACATPRRAWVPGQRLRPEPPRLRRARLRVGPGVVTSILKRQPPGAPPDGGGDT